MDKISLEMALQSIMPWGMVYVAEPTRPITIEMTYADLMNIVSLIQFDPRKIDAFPKWIPCNERLPESYGKYIVTSGNSVSVVVHMLCYGEAMSDNPCWFFYDSEYGYVTVDDVIAWMPLPEPYKGKEQDDALDS